MASIKHAVVVADGQGGSRVEVQELDTETQEGALVRIDVRLQELVMFCADYEDTFGSLPNLGMRTRLESGTTVSVEIKAK